MKTKSPISPARKAAFAVLMAVERGQSHSDDLLRGRAVQALSPPDRNLATALALGVLRWQIRLDRQLQPLLARPNAKLDPEVLIALRLGAFQLLHMDRIPARAAIDESVELAKQAGHRFASGMVNAVLRKLAIQAAGKLAVLKGHDFGRAASATKERWALAPEGMLPPDGPAQSLNDLAPAEAHPAWLVDRWTSFYGLPTTRAVCHHGQSQPALVIRLTTPDVEAELAESGIRLEPGQLLTAARIVISGDIAAAAAFREGRARIQDEGSQLVAELASFASENLNQSGKRILDACAAPGGKTLILAERNPHSSIVGCESSPQRLEQMRKRLAAQAGHVECRLGDATLLSDSDAYDLVLADVPCSGTGTLGRNPEIRHRLRPEDLTRQAARQRAILHAALRALRPGGRVVYSTCSLEPEENEQVVAAVLRESTSARGVPIEPSIDSLAAAGILTPTASDRLRARITPEGHLRLLPGTFQTDGFFIAMLERTG